MNVLVQWNAVDNPARKGRWNMGAEDAAKLEQMHYAQKRLQNLVFGLLLVPAAVYFVVPSAAVLWGGALGGLGGWLYLAGRRRALRKAYGEAACSWRAWLVRFLVGLGFTASPERVGFGYLESGAGMSAVLLHVEGDTLHVLENPLRKKCLYAVENDFCYVFEPAPDAAPVRRAISLAGCELRPGRLNHRDFLVKQQRLTGDIGSVEMFVYDQVICRARTGAPDPFLNCASSLAGKRKEKIFAASLSPECTLHIPADVCRRLALAG